MRSSSVKPGRYRERRPFFPRCRLRSLLHALNLAAAVRVARGCRATGTTHGHNICVVQTTPEVLIALRIHCCSMAGNVAQLDPYNVQKMSVLKRPDSAKARELLETVARQVQPILRRR